jgi:stearoyl-CoA desaturase (delta-9 desaturase)
MLSLTHNQQVRSLQIINHLLSIAGLIYVINSQQWHWLVIGFVMYWTIGILGVNIGLHRLLSHRSFKTGPITEKLLSVVGVISTLGSPIAWAATHRQHHRATDTLLDPHSPSQIGIFCTWFGIWPKIKYDTKLIRDMRQSLFQKQLHRNYLWIILGYVTILFAAGGWLAVIFCYCLPACLCLHSASALNVIAHLHGYQNHICNNQSKNSWIANIITLGEGWHNNHHAKPWAWTTQERWWEWDPTAVIIRLIKI